MILDLFLYETFEGEFLTQTLSNQNAQFRNNIAALKSQNNCNENFLNILSLIYICPMLNAMHGLVNFFFSKVQNCINPKFYICLI